MGYKALITLDLTDTTSEQRKIFYEYLTNENWIKINNLTTAWQVAFNDKTLRENAVSIIFNDLQIAKNKSKVLKVNYAIQMDNLDVIISSL